MSKLIEYYEEVNSLIDSHGDVSDCKHKNCGKCNRIIELRKIIAPPEKRGRKSGVSHGKRSAYRLDYFVIGNGEKHVFKSQREVREFLKTSYPILRDMLDRGKSFKGYTITVENREEDANELE